MWEAIVAMIVVQQRSLKAEIGNFGYFAKLDKLSWLRTRIDALREEVLLSQMYPAKLASPVHVPSKAVSPRRGLAILLGVFLGRTLGLLYSLGRDGWRKMD